jgi:hypothetical protein
MTRKPPAPPPVHDTGNSSIRTHVNKINKRFGRIMSWIALPLSVDPVAFVSILVGNLNDPSRAETACLPFVYQARK